MVTEPAPPPDPDELLNALREAAGPPPLPPLRLSPPSGSHGRGPIGSLITGIRGLAVRILAPSLLDLIGQLERDRTRQDAEIARLNERVSQLERDRTE
jgi:hypothetical protein